MTCVTATKCLCHKWIRICSICRNHNPVLSWLLTWFEKKSNRTGVTCGEATANTYEAPELTPIFSRVRVARFFVLCVVFCISLFVLFILFFWPLYCLPIFDLRLLITPLVSSNSFCIRQNQHFVLNWLDWCSNSMLFTDKSNSQMNSPFLFNNQTVDLMLAKRGRRGCDRMVVVFTTTCATSAYHH